MHATSPAATLYNALANSLTRLHETITNPATDLGKTTENIICYGNNDSFLSQNIL